GADGAGAHSVVGAAPLSSAGRMGPVAGSGSNPGSADVAREVADSLPRSGPRGAVERGVSETMDHGGTGCRAGLLCRWPRAGVSRQIDGPAQTLRGPAATVSTGDGGLLDQRHGRPAVLLYQPSCGSWLGGGVTRGFGAVAGGQ